MSDKRDVSDHGSIRELEDLLDSLPVLVSYIDRDLRYVLVNRTYEEWFQRSRSDTVGKTIAELLGQAAYESLKPHIQRVLSGQKVTFESRVPYATGTRWIQATYLPRFGPGKEVTGFIALVTDLTNRKATEDAQQDSLEQFRTLAALAPVGIFRTDSKGDCQYVNERWCQYTGMTLRQSLGQGWASALHPEDRERVSAAWYKAATAGEEFLLEYRFLTPKGTVSWMEGRASALRDAQGKVIGYLGTVTDITERRLAQDRERFLAEASALLVSSIELEKTLQNVAKMAVPQFADWSAVHLKETGGKARKVAIFSADPAKGRLVEDLLANHPADPEGQYGVASVLRSATPMFYPEIGDSFLQQLATSPEHLRKLRALGVKSSITVPILVRGDIRGAISFATAVTGRTFVKDDLALAEELARRAAMAIDNAQHYQEAQNAVRAREEFLSIASHEMKTPLTILLLQLQGLRREVRKEEGRSGSVAPEIVAGPVDKAMAKGQELADLINDLLDVSSMVAGHPKLDLVPDVDLVDSVRHVVSSFSEVKHRGGAPIHIDAPPSLKGTWDPVRVEQVLTNLISNAIKYGAEKDIYVKVVEEGPVAAVSVRDQGIGIQRADRDRIFKPFERAVPTSQYTGWGLGLHIVKQIVEAHGGTVWLESAPGQGALFTVRLPRSPKPA